jgi:hypothetical protein
MNLPIFDASHYKWKSILPKHDDAFYFFLTRNGLVVNNIKSLEIEKEKTLQFLDFLHTELHLDYTEDGEFEYYLFYGCELFKMTINLAPVQPKNCIFMGNIYPILDIHEDYEKARDYIVSMTEHQHFEATLDDEFDKHIIKL